MFDQTIRALRLAGIAPYFIPYLVNNPAQDWLEDLHNDPDGRNADQTRACLKSSMTRFWQELDEVIQR